MFRRSRYPWATTLIAFLILTGVLLGLWLAVMAAQENIRMARATDQILNIVSTARNARNDAVMSDEQATEGLMSRLGPKSRYSRGGGQGTLENAWGGVLKIQVQAKMQQVRLETFVSPVACRRLTDFLGKDPAALGLRKVETRDDALNLGWRAVYEAPSERNAEKAKIYETAIRAGCGATKLTILALTFKLR